MHGLRPRFVYLAFTALLMAVSCAVFPDEAILPGSAGSTSGSSSSAGNADVLAGNGGEPNGTGTAGAAGMMGGAGGASSAGTGGAPIEPAGGVGGAGGAGGSTNGGAPNCSDVQQRVQLVMSDTWIDEAKPATTHGIDKQLSLGGGAGAERRVLLVLPLPARPAGSELLKATLQLNVEANADTSLAQRQLGLYGLTQDFVENRATWVNYDNGGTKKWAAAGGDVGAEIGTALLAANSTSGVLSFDVTAAVDQVLEPQPVPLSVIILESGNVPAAPAELAFGSSEGDASGPSLVLEFCQP